MGKRKKSRVSRDEDEEDEVVQEEEGSHSSSNDKSLYEVLPSSFKILISKIRGFGLFLPVIQ